MSVRPRLEVYGHVFFAGARTLERLLPSPQNAEQPAVILRLRGRTLLGATLVGVLSRYAEKIKQVNGRLYLTGLSEEVHAELEHMRKLRLLGPLRAFEATTIRGQSTRAAHADAEAWLVSQGELSPETRNAPPLEIARYYVLLMRVR